jgi:hypothetical protein
MTACSGFVCAAFSVGMVCPHRVHTLPYPLNVLLQLLHVFSSIVVDIRA